jgi:HNH endonuclease.
MKTNMESFKRNCVICGSVFETHYQRKIACSKSCSFSLHEAGKKKGQLERTREWRKKNPDKYKESKHKSDKKYLMVHGDKKTPEQKKEMFGFHMLLHPDKYPKVVEHLGITRKQLMDRFNILEGCCYCGSKNKKSVEHLFPTSKGGQHIINNLFGACTKCNSSKSNNDFFEWYRSQSFYNPERECVILQNSFAG